MPGITQTSGFTIAELTDAINRKPFLAKLLSSLPIWTERRVATTTVEVESDTARIHVITSSPRDTPSPVSGADRPRRKDAYVLPRVAEARPIGPGQVQNVRSFGSGSELQPLTDKIDEVQTDLAGSMDATLERLMQGAVQGVILDGDGSTITDLYARAGVSKPATVNIDVSDGTAIETELMDITRAIVDAGEGLIDEGVEIGAVAGRTAFARLATAPEMRSAYERYQSGVFQRTNKAYRSFRPTSNVEIFDYAGSGAAKVPDNEVRFFPMSSNVFSLYYGPANKRETVNTLGLPRYSWLEEADDRILKVHGEMAALPLCLLPLTLRSATVVAS